MKTKQELTMPGSRVRETHAATVLSIVGADRMIPVESRGTGFFMRGAFGWRTVAGLLTRGVTDAPALARGTGNRVTPGIVIAETPDEVSRRTYLALIGGAYHEAFHRLYSQQGPLDARVIERAISPAHKVSSLTRRAKLIMDLQNVYEDVAIERIGNAEFPGVHTKMCDLADYIVKMEAEGRAAAGNPPTTLVNAVFVALRDIGLGYSTTIVRENLARIKSECPKGFGMVAPGGALHGILLRAIPDVSSPAAIARAKQAILDGSALTLALETVSVLESVANGEMQQGEGQKGEGQKAEGQNGEGQKGEGQKAEGQKAEGQKGEGQKAEGQKAEGQKGEGQKGEGQKGEGQKGEGQKGEGQKGEGQKAEGQNGEGQNGEQGDGEQGDGEQGDGEDTLSNSEGTGAGAGGGEGTSPATARDFLDGHAKDGKGTMDSGAALAAGVESEREKSPDNDESLPYRPYSTSNDEVIKVRPSKEHAASFSYIVREVSKGTGYLRTRLAVLFRALENSGTEHGVRKGQRLSDRMIVNSTIEMRNGNMPTRAYQNRTPAVDMSIAATLVIDESNSMKDKLRETCAAAYTLLDALDSIGAKSMAIGFRTKSYDPAYATGDYAGASGCHRTHSMYYDVFKSWSDSFKVAAPRLREIRATGGTPMADGVEFALRELSSRPEGHRILFVLTDGQPDGNHARVLKSQLQRAAEAGVLVIGVGLGRGSEYVKKTFPDSVFAPDLAALPALLVKKLEELVRTRSTGEKRGRSVRAA
jgi:hypothetical protein